VSVVREWLDFLYKGSPGFFALTPFKNGRPVRTVWYGTDPKSLARAARTIEHHAATHDLYVSVATHKRIPESGRGSGKTVQSIPGFWMDLDVGTAGHKPAELPNPPDEAAALSVLQGLPEPSAVVHSGGGLQVWWKFAEPWVFDDPTDAARASEAWHRMLAQRAEAKGFHVDAVGDLPRILRVPGTENHKLDEARPVTLHSNGGPRHSTTELAALGTPLEDVYAEHGLSPTDDPLGSWEDILEPHGCKKVGTRETDGAALWQRPGKDPREGHSFVTDPYGVPVLVNFSASWGLPTGPNQRLTKFKVWTQLNFDGDSKAAKAALRRLVKDTPSKLAEIAERFAGARIDWAALWTEEDLEPEWLVEPLLERGRQIAVYSDPKAGKSLLMHELVPALALGRAVVSNPARDPITVVYIDEENTKKDLRERLWKQGYEGATFDRLAYYTFPNLAFLDTEEGARQIYALAKVNGADLVVLDTLSRMTEGLENDNDTFNAFYKYTGVRLKADGIALARLDHTGKDRAKGMRGAASKATDVDEVWELHCDKDEADLVTLTRTHSRSYHGESTVPMQRIGNPKPGADDPTNDPAVRLRTVVLSERGGSPS
jgi:hypothetical protein